jgi:hypothetical protein
MVERSSSFFRGSELPRLAILSIVMLAGWGFFWSYAQQHQAPVEPPVTVEDRPQPVVADGSMEFETVKDRTPMSFRDNAAYTLLLGRARGKTPAELATESRRDLLLTHLWERPELYRGVPVHILGSALRVLRYESKLSKTGWLYEAWVMTPEQRRAPYVCVFEDVPKGFPIGADVSERVVFNGYFLKLMQYEAGDKTRGAPVLVGRIGWDPPEPTAANAGGMSPTLRWSLIGLGLMFVISLSRWVVQLRRLLTRPVSFETAKPTPNDELDPAALSHWVESVAHEDSDLPAPQLREDGR